MKPDKTLELDIKQNGSIAAEIAQLYVLAWEGA
jgi:hypothetical protein